MGAPVQTPGVDMAAVRNAYTALWALPDSLLATTVGHATLKLVKSLMQTLPSEPEVGCR